MPCHRLRARTRTIFSNEIGAIIIATTADYATVRELVADVFAEGIEATVPGTARETVDAVVALKKHEVSLGELAAKLALDKSVTSLPGEGRNRPRLSRQPGHPQRSARADRSWRSDAGNGEAAAEPARTGLLIECCTAAEGDDGRIPSQCRVLRCCSIPQRMDLVPRAAIRIEAVERLDSTHCGRSHRNEGVSAQRGLHACSQL